MRAIRGLFYPGEMRNSFRDFGGEGQTKKRWPETSLEWLLSVTPPPLGMARVPDLERVVLTILYVPQRLPVEQQLRVLRVPPRLCWERHQRGLQMFWTLWRLTA